MTRDFKKQAAWRKHNTVAISINLNSNTDADIIGYIDRKVEAGATKQGVIKEALRHELEREGGADDGS